MNKKIAFLQSFGIILVVLGYSGNTGQEFTLLNKWIYALYMPLFVFISGYLLNYSCKGKLSEINTLSFIMEKFKILLVPYFVISSITYIYFFKKFTKRTLDIVFNYIHNLFYPFDNPIGFFWFLPTAFTCILLMIFLVKLLKENIEIILILSICSTLFLTNYIKINFLGISGVLNYFIFFTLGFYYNLKETYIDEKLKKYKILLFILTSLILVINLKLNLALNSLILKKLWYLLISILGIIFSILLSFIYNEKECKFLNHLYGKSYSIYLLSCFPQVFVRIVFYQIFGLSKFIVYPISFVLGVYIPYFFNLFMLKYNKLKIFNTIFGIK